MPDDQGMSEKVLVILADNQVKIYHTDGVETACVVDGEDIELPDDWRELPRKVVHLVPFERQGSEESLLAAGKLVQENPLEQITPLHVGAISQDELFGQLFTTKQNPGEHRTLMRSPYCYNCDTNHPLGQCEGPEPSFDYSCRTCGAAQGEKHKTSCSDQNPLVVGGDIVR